MESTVDPSIMNNLRGDLEERFHASHWLLGACVSGISHEYCRSSEEYLSAAFYLLNVIEYAFFAFGHRTQLLAIADVGWLHYYLGDVLMGCLDVSRCSSHVDVPDSVRIPRMFPTMAATLANLGVSAETRKKFRVVAIQGFDVAYSVMGLVFGWHSAFCHDVMRLKQRAEAYVDNTQ